MTGEERQSAEPPSLMELARRRAAAAAPLDEQSDEPEERPSSGESPAPLGSAVPPTVNRLCPITLQPHENAQEGDRIFLGGHWLTVHAAHLLQGEKEVSCRHASGAAMRLRYTRLPLTVYRLEANLLSTALRPLRPEDLYPGEQEAP